MSGRSRNKKRGSGYSSLLLKLVGGTLFVLSVVVTLSHHGLPPHATEVGANLVALSAPSSGAAAVQGSAAGIPVDPAVLDLIRIQNETIIALRRQLEAVTAAKLSGSDGSGSSIIRGDGGRDSSISEERSASSSSRVEDHGSASHSLMATQLASAQAEVAALRSQALLLPATSGGNSNDGSGKSLPNLLRTGLDEECEARFGLGLSDMIRSQKQEWCAMPKSSASSPGEGGSLPSSIHCYPYLQEHKKTGKKAGNREMFCEGTNILIDFSKVSGSHGATKPHLGAQYLTFGKGATSATCAPTSAWNPSLFMPHMARQLGGKDKVQFERPVPRSGSYTVAKGDTYLLARDEDCENMFHSSADHINLFNVAQVLGLDFQTLQVVLFDRHFDGPFHDLIQTAFSPNKPLRRIEDYKGQLVLFERLVWHLESPAGIVFPKVGGPTGLMRCHGSSLWDQFRKHVLKSFNLLDVPPPPVPHVLMSFRRRSRSKNVGRVFANENVLTDVLSEGNLIKVTSIDLGTIPFRQQLALVRSANVMVGAHGAGLMHVMFMAEEAVLVEIHPSYRLDRHFRLASRMTGKVYLPMRTTDPVTCQGSSDAIPVNKNEFRATMDAAIRIARSFDDGASECGLKCNPSILALDRGNDPEYQKAGMRKGSPLSTKFPCH